MKPKPPSVLIVDDEAELCRAFEAYLSRHGFDVRTAGGGSAADTILAGWTPDIAVLDLALRGESGFDVAARIAAGTAEPPAILFLSGQSGRTERILGLESGAEDFLEKPIAPRILLARLNSILRRLGRSPPGALLMLGGVAIDPAAQCLIGPDGAETPLAWSEFALLKCFLDEPHRLFSRDELLDRAPASEEAVMDRSIDRRIGRLRRKLAAWNPRVEPIETVPGLGYRLNADLARSLA
jgi:two-component system, OmpR family, response regulator